MVYVKRGNNLNIHDKYVITINEKIILIIYHRTETGDVKSGGFLPFKHVSTYTMAEIDVNKIPNKVLTESIITCFRGNE